MRVRLLMLTSDARGGVAVALDSGLLLRAHWAVPAEQRLGPYDVVEGDGGWHEESAFAADTMVVADPVKVGRMRGRKVNRLLAPLVQPPTKPLFGAVTPTVPYWTLGDQQPSLAIVAPDAGPVVERDRLLQLRCRFRWRRLDHDLPLADPNLEEKLSHPTATRLTGATLARAVGWVPERLVVALTPPRQGQCHKVVAGLLPRP